LAIFALCVDTGLLHAQLENHPDFVCNYQPPQLAPEEKICTSIRCIPQDGSWDEESLPDGTSCRVPPKGWGTCQTGWCNDCQIPTAAGSLQPSYVVIGLVYSPPGCTGCTASTVDYQDAGTVGTTLSTEKSFNQDYTLSVGASVLGTDREVSGDYSTTGTSSTSQTISQTQQNDIKATGNQDGINHDQDTFIILLNPSISVYSGENFHPPSSSGACVPAIQWRTGIDGPSAQPYTLTVQDLKSLASLTALYPNVGAVMQLHGITQTDFDTIRSLDPFANGPAPIDSGRYVRTTHTFAYRPPDTSQTCNSQGCTCMVMSSAKIDNELAASTTTNKTSYSVGLKESNGFNIQMLNATENATQKFTWTTTASEVNTTSSTKSATVTIPCPSLNWKAPEDYTQIDVYWDTWYGSFMFSPTVVAEAAAGSNTFIVGHAQDKSGQPLRQEPVDVAAYGTTYHTITDSHGEYRVYGIAVKRTQQTQKMREAIVRVRSKSYKVALGSLQPSTITID
jgi:hypothetical protein